MSAVAVIIPETTKVAFRNRATANGYLETDFLKIMEDASLELCTQANAARGAAHRRWHHQRTGRTIEISLVDAQNQPFALPGTAEEPLCAVLSMTMPKELHTLDFTDHSLARGRLSMPANRQTYGTAIEHGIPTDEQYRDNVNILLDRIRKFMRGCERQAPMGAPAGPATTALKKV